MELGSLPESYGGENWGVEAYSDRMLVELPEQEVQDLIARLHYLNTGVDPEPPVTQSFQEESP